MRPALSRRRFPGLALAAGLSALAAVAAEVRTPPAPVVTNRAPAGVTNGPWCQTITAGSLTGTNLLRALNQQAKSNEFQYYPGTPAGLFPWLQSRPPEAQLACAAAAFPPPGEGVAFVQRFLPALLALANGEDSVYVSRNYGIDNRSENNVLWRASTRLRTGFQTAEEFNEFVSLLRNHQVARSTAPIAAATPPSPAAAQAAEPDQTATGQGDCFAGGIIGRGRAWRLNVTCTNAITLDGIRLTRSRTGARQRHLIPGQPCRPGDRLDHALNDYFKPAPEPGDLVELVQHELVLFTVVVPQPPPSAEAADDFSGMYFRDAPVPARRVGRNVPVPARQTLYFDRANLTVRLELDLFDDTLDGNQLVRTFHGEMAGEKVFVGKPEAGRPDSTAMVTWNDPPRAIKLQFHGDTAEVTFEKRTNSVTATFTRKVR
jgi:hypothetical protein